MKYQTKITSEHLGLMMEIEWRLWELSSEKPQVREVLMQIINWRRKNIKPT